MYAIIETGGKQYQIVEGAILDVERLPAEEGQDIEIDRVLALGGEGTDFKVGTPLIEGAKVKLNILRHIKGRKITIYKYKPKNNYRRKKGHRQPYTRVRVKKIICE